MSDPYNQYPQNYSSPAHGGQGYPPSGQYHDQSQGGGQYGYPPQQQGYPPQDQGYGQHGYPPQAQQYNDAPAGYGPPQRTNSYGPPQHGGFQHGQEGAQFGAYDASNPQGHPGY